MKTCAGHKEVIPMRSVVGDVRKLTELRIATRDVTTVVHTAGVVSFGTFPDNQAMNDVNARGLDQSLCFSHSFAYIKYGWLKIRTWKTVDHFHISY